MNMNTISLDDFKKLEIKIGEILAAERVPETDKLLRLSVAMGEVNPETGESLPRVIVSGIAGYFPDPHTLVGKKCAFAANLEPRVIRGVESRGMILAASTEDGTGEEKGKFSLLEVSPEMPAGTRVK